MHPGSIGKYRRCWRSAIWICRSATCRYPLVQAHFWTRETSKWSAFRRAASQMVRNLAFGCLATAWSLSIMTARSSGCSSVRHLRTGEVGVMIYDGQGYIKAYAEQEPDDPEAYLGSDGVRRMQPVMVSYNKAYAPKPASPELGSELWGESYKSCLLDNVCDMILSSKVYPAFLIGSERALNTHARLDELLHERNMTLYQLCQSGNIPTRRFASLAAEAASFL